MKIEEGILKVALVSGDYLKVDDFSRAVEQSKKQKLDLSDYLLAQDLVTKDLLGQALAEFYHLPYADLNTHVPTKEAVLLLPEELAKKYRCIIFSVDKQGIKLSTDSPELAATGKAELEKLLHQEPQFVYSLPEDIDSVMLFYRATLETRFAKIIKEQKRLAPEIFIEIIADAVNLRASDIHFEPQDQELIIRFRIDGLLQEAARIEKQYYDNILNHIKVLAHVRTDEHSRAQDGAIRLKHDQLAIDLRISIVPTLDGEKVVVRLLAEYVRGLSLNELGLSATDQEQVASAARKPFGMILVSGPTGSGKTTTLYSIVKLLNKPEINIATIEDPVEYKIPGVNHIQVNEQADITFARGLRAIVRQDPNIILVGEIRDKETSEIAVNAALTGHLLLSSFHANDAATCIPRLLDMGIEPFLLASTLELIVAQRLVRRLCDSCRYSYTTTVAELDKIMPQAKEFFTDQAISLYKAKGCRSCNQTGYRGRIAVFESIRLSTELRSLILQQPSAEQVRALATQQGGHNLYQDAMTKVKSGITSLEEVLRVVAP